MTGNLNFADIEKLCVVLEASKIHMLKSDEYFELIFDSGCSKVVTPHLTYFVSGSITKLEKLMAMGGIVVLLVFTQKGRIRYEVINNSVGLSIL